MTEECKKEIDEYLRSMGYVKCISSPFSDDDRIIIGWFNGNKLNDVDWQKWWKGTNEDRGYYDKYLLEYISKILVKNKINKITVGKYYGIFSNNIDTTYSSTSWKFKEIKRIL